MAEIQQTMENGKTTIKVIISEHEAWNGAVVQVCVRKDSFMDGLQNDTLAYVMLEATEWDNAGKDGTLYLCAQDDNNDASWENYYPDYFSRVWA